MDVAGGDVVVGLALGEKAAEPGGKVEASHLVDADVDVVALLGEQLVANPAAGEAESERF